MTAAKPQVQIGPPADLAAAHQLLLVGTGPAYLILDEPGPFQMILEVELVGRDEAPVAAFIRDKKVTGEKYYSLVTAPIVLRDLALGKAGAAARTTFHAELLRGRVGQGGSTMIPEVIVRIKRVVVSRNRAPASDGYVLFGDQRELFAARLESAPDAPTEVLAVRLVRGIKDQAEADRVALRSLLSTGAPLGVGQTQEAVVSLGKRLLPVTVATLARTVGD